MTEERIEWLKDKLKDADYVHIGMWGREMSWDIQADIEELIQERIVVAESRKEGIEVLQKRGEWISQVHNLFFEMLCADVDKYGSGHHAKGCKAVKYWDVPQPCDCIMGRLMDLMRQVEDGELAEAERLKEQGK